jgi:hypothetical protein
MHTKIILKMNNEPQICISSVQFSIEKENCSNETKIFSNIKFKVLRIWADNKVNNDMLAILHTSN